MLGRPLFPPLSFSSSLCSVPVSAPMPGIQTSPSSQSFDAGSPLSDLKIHGEISPCSSPHTAKRRFKREPVRGPESAEDARFHEGITFSFGRPDKSSEFLHIISRQFSPLAHQHLQNVSSPLRALASPPHAFAAVDSESESEYEESPEDEVSTELEDLYVPLPVQDSDDDPLPLVMPPMFPSVSATTSAATVSSAPTVSCGAAAAPAKPRKRAHPSSHMHAGSRSMGHGGSAAAFSPLSVPSAAGSPMPTVYPPGRKPKQCACCGCTSTPLWRDMGRDMPLCNACGIRWKKYGIVCDVCSYVPCKQEREHKYCKRCKAVLPPPVKRVRPDSPSSLGLSSPLAAPPTSAPAAAPAAHTVPKKC